jgi:hypothetical protein
MVDDERKIGAQRPCGCVAYGAEVVLCNRHYRAWLEESAANPHQRQDAGDRRHALRVSA